MGNAVRRWESTAAAGGNHRKKYDPGEIESAIRLLLLYEKNLIQPSRESPPTAGHTTASRKYRLHRKASRPVRWFEGIRFRSPAPVAAAGIFPTERGIPNGPHPAPSAKFPPAEDSPLLSCLTCNRRNIGTRNVLRDHRAGTHTGRNILFEVFAAEAAISSLADTHAAQ